MTSVIKKETVKRILLDNKELIDNPLNEQGIYYQHDEDNLLKGYAMILGPESTPYQNGFFFFLFEFPSNYPYSPPKVTFINRSQYVRYNPNYYQCGKVCLSILNTWKGESWSSCQTISSILLTLCITFQSKPIYNEPGPLFTDKQSDDYNSMIEYYTHRDALCIPLIHVFVLDKPKKINHNGCYIETFYLEMFKSNIIEIFKIDYKDKLLKHIQQIIMKKDLYDKTLTCNMYNMCLHKIDIDYDIIYSFINSIKLN